jgi:hypothetical protein
MLFTEVQAFQAVAQTSANLLTSALTPATTDDRWQEGFSFRGELCPDLEVYDPCGDPSATPPDLNSSRPTYIQPVAYRLRDECSTLAIEQSSDRLMRMALAAGSYAAADELWTGRGTAANPRAAAPDGSTVNPYLADGNAVIIPNSGSTAVTNELDAIGLLEQEARQHTRGQQVFLHLPIRLITRVGAQLRRVGNEIRTHTDAIVIADAGYPGTGPTDGGTRSVQTVTITGAPTGGTFTLTRGGHTTAPIAFNATAAAVQAALLTAGSDPVTVTGSGPYVVHTTAAGVVAPMTATGSFTGGTAPAVTVANTTPGVAPAPLAGLWSYATGPVEVRLGEVALIDDPPSTVDRASNVREIWADRMLGVAFDPCCQLAILVPVP